MNQIIQARDLHKRYQLGKENYVDALRGATLDIAAGEMVAIMGPSGSGKSTLMHILGCLDTPDGGELILRGRRIEGLSARALTQIRRVDVGIIFQGYNLVASMTAAENVALAAEYAGKSKRDAQRAAAEALEAVGLADRAHHLPSELSGGQQQRAAIARALVNRPAVVLGDEPTGNLDTATSAEVVAMMREVNLSTGTTFVLVTHNPEVASECDRIIEVRDGAVVEERRAPGPRVEPALV